MNIDFNKDKFRFGKLLQNHSSKTNSGSQSSGNGILITFEGIEGCGKSTQAKMLHEFFIENKIESIITREPGGSKAGEKIRTILLDENIESLEAKTELLLNFASRIEHIEKTIKPNLKQNKAVICDRFFDSSFAYQGSAQNLGEDIVLQIKNLTIGDFVPDITFLIDIEVEQAFSRLVNRIDNNRYEKLGFEFHQKVRSGFLELAKKNSRIKVINGSETPQQIFKKIINYIKL